MGLEKVNGQVLENRLRRPGDREGLRRWVESHLGLHLAEFAVCAGHQVPLDYLEYVFFEKGPAMEGAEGGSDDGGGGDAVIWACRGGGKTMMGAVATLLDMLFKPGVQVRILGGSKEQSEKMYTYLCEMVSRKFADQVKGKITGQRVRLKNGSGCEILSQSARSVRGVRVQKLRCDELELFEPKVWEAAQLATRSLVRKNRETVRGTVEVFSTMHLAGGLMQQLCGQELAAAERTAHDVAEAGGQTGAKGIVVGRRRVFTWCIFEAMAGCEMERRCDKCALVGDCNGRAKRGNGFVPLEDVLVMHERVSKQAWENEMLCYLPYDPEKVFGAFTRGRHGRPWDLSRGQPRAGDKVMVEERELMVESVVAGVDFGYGCFVCLWMAMLRDKAGRRVVWVLEEYVAHQATLAVHVKAIKNKPVRTTESDAWEPAVVYCDVAGEQHDAHSGETSLAVMKRAGFVVKASAMEVEDGIGRLLALIDPAMRGPVEKKGGKGKKEEEEVPWEPVRFYVHGKCERLMEALEGYKREKGKPVKDGVHDHLIDALRYAVVNHDKGGGKVGVRSY